MTMNREPTPYEKAQVAVLLSAGLNQRAVAELIHCRPVKVGRIKEWLMTARLGEVKCVLDQGLIDQVVAHHRRDGSLSQENLMAVKRKRGLTIFDRMAVISFFQPGVEPEDRAHHRTEDYLRYHDHFEALAGVAEQVRKRAEVLLRVKQNYSLKSVRQSGNVIRDLGFIRLDKQGNPETRLITGTLEEMADITKPLDPSKADCFWAHLQQRGGKLLEAAKIDKLPDLKASRVNDDIVRLISELASASSYQHCHECPVCLELSRKAHAFQTLNSW